MNGIIDSNQKIVTNGLVLNLDAAQLRSYPTTGTAWTDLSGTSNNATLTNGPTFNSANGGSIVFDGTNDYAPSANTFTLTEATFISWVNQNGSQPNFTGILFSRTSDAAASGLGTSYQFTTNQLGYIWNGAVNTYSWGSGLIIPTSAWCMVAITVTATSATGYLCKASGITSATNTVSHSSSLTKFEIGRDSYSLGGRYFKGNIAQSLLYNRALSSTEITQNFNAVKSRFGL